MQKGSVLRALYYIYCLFQKDTRQERVDSRYSIDRRTRQIIQPEE